jgi:phenylacetate-coenzyme A ligase PaaK-like adenylate-forming protein
MPRARVCTAGRDHFLFETIDPETLQTLPMGESGEPVITTLSKEALPMIRYRTRDVTRLNNEPCICGRTHVRIMRVTGRNDDMLIVRSVNVCPFAGRGGSSRPSGLGSALSGAHAGGHASRYDGRDRDGMAK